MVARGSGLKKESAVRENRLEPSIEEQPKKPQCSASAWSETVIDIFVFEICKTRDKTADTCTKGIEDTTGGNRVEAYEVKVTQGMNDPSLQSSPIMFLTKII
jgi:hypothetical protein